MHRPFNSSRRRVHAAAGAAARAMTLALALPLAGMPAAAALAAIDTPVGLWKTIDDETKQPRAFVRIVDEAGVLTGRIERILPPGKPDARCEQCTDERKGQPVLGMAILSGLRRNGETWEGGRILDPSNGKTYQARVKLTDDGQRLDVRGFIGTPLLGRSQVWLREQ